jgi:predicted phage-related endonuclease
MNYHDYKTREDWLAARTTFIGASETAAIFGQGYASQSPFSVWASKVHPDAKPDEKESRRLQNGTDMQPIIIELAKENLQ